MKLNQQTQLGFFIRESRSLLPLCFPAVISQLAQVAFTLTDTLVVADLGTTPLAALSLGSMVYNFVLMSLIGIFVSLNPLAAQANGRKNKTHVGRLNRQGIYLALFFGTFGMLALQASHLSFELLGVNKSIQSDAKVYLQAISFSVWPSYLFLSLRAVHEGVFVTKPVMLVSLIGIPCNFLLDLALVHGIGDFAGLGIAGAGYATCIIWTLMTLALFLYTIKQPRFKPYELFNHFELPNRTIMAHILRHGLTISLGIVLEMGMFTAMTIFISQLTVEALAAHQVALNIGTTLFMIPLGVAIAASARVGFAAGSGSVFRVKLAKTTSLVYSACFTVFAGLMVILFRHEIIACYTADAGITAMASILLIWLGIFQIADAIQITALYCLRGLNDTMAALKNNALSYWVIGIPASYLLGQTFHLIGFWAGCSIGLFCAAWLHNKRFNWFATQKKAWQI